MKNMFSTFKWIKSQCGKYLFQVLIIILIGSILSIASVFRALVSKDLVDAAISGKTSRIIRPLIMLAVFILAEIFFKCFSLFLTANCSAKLSASIQKRLYSHILKAKWQQQIKYHSGHLLTRITSDVGAISDLIINTTPYIVSLLILLVTSFITLYHFEPKLALSAIIVIPICIFIGRSYGRKLKDIHKESQEADSTYRSFMQESIQNLLILKTFCLEKNNLSKLTELQNNKIKLSLKRSSISIVANIFMSIGSWIGFFLVFCWGAVNLSKGIGTYGTLTALLQLVSSIQAPFFGLAGSLPQLAGAVGSAERLIEIEKMTLENIDYEELDSTSINISTPNIEFKNVSFSYLQNSPVLRDISFNIKAGETIGVMGASGEGKTTIIRLILSLIDAGHGNIYINSNNEKYSINPSTRSLLSYVPQGNTLFSGTIRENLLFGNNAASEEDIASAVTASGALNFINSFKDKLNTVIGEKGVGLSEGQAQRLAIARALLRKKPILILDEATSSLDIETELRVLSTIQNLEHNPTCIIITHRTSALSICDRLFKLENGFLKEITNYPKVESAASSIQQN